eukprot:CAMPEP_0175294862 /NCGR_PEP_ID=MMETSP0093-20121207/58216_1 /TAXON_ID=311494 /ORGANISM="Alexandrium monilatum, Strain CCMP3105" /LENGTH=131 /DNA_ID=CAMNT_0016590809 /DNA_START=36 /DNA_END=432 /DNA_ORIENTATION=-
MEGAAGTPGAKPAEEGGARTQDEDGSEHLTVQFASGGWSEHVQAKVQVLVGIRKPSLEAADRQCKDGKGVQLRQLDSASLKARPLWSLVEGLVEVSGLLAGASRSQREAYRRSTSKTEDRAGKCAHLYPLA